MNDNQPIVKTEQVIVVSILSGTGTQDDPTGYTHYYYKADGTLIGMGE